MARHEPFAGARDWRSRERSVYKARMRKARLLLFLAACGGAGPYGFAETYAPLRDERDHHRDASNLNYEEIRGDARGHRSTLVGWFGTVQHIDVQGDRATVRLAHRTLAPRNLCADERTSSCRVTVSEREGGTFTATIHLRPSEREGEEKIWVGSLLRVFGHPTGDVSDEDGVVLSPVYHRHWPRGSFVTTAARGQMRR